MKKSRIFSSLVQESEDDGVTVFFKMTYFATNAPFSASFKAPS